MYECLVMPFSLTSLQAFISKFVVVYFDDILIYTKILFEHVVHLKYVLDVLRKEKYFANLNKCIFCTNI